eukprot:11710114-Alexandrium_andersonii.AAC.1
MSASLVGSEMCIRDSCLIVPLIGVGEGQTVQEQQRCPHWTVLVLRRETTDKPSSKPAEPSDSQVRQLPPQQVGCSKCEF